MESQDAALDGEVFNTSCDGGLLDAFIAEARELLPGMREAAARIAAGEDGPRVALARWLHGLRGTAGFFGLDGLCTLFIDAEKLLDQRDFAGELPVVLTRVARAIEACAPEPRRAERKGFTTTSLGPGLTLLAAELARGLGKRVSFEMTGAAAGLDNAAMGRLRDALVQLLRNAVDHGIEAPAARRAAGKPERGRIVVRVARGAGLTKVSFTDDGAGLDPDRLAAHARRLGAAAGGAVSQLAFIPGLSTAAAESSVSGRGMGLDVVRDSLRRLGGSVTLSSEPGIGTRVLLMIPDRKRPPG